MLQINKRYTPKQQEINKLKNVIVKASMIRNLLALCDNLKPLMSRNALGYAPA